MHDVALFYMNYNLWRLHQTLRGNTGDASGR
jgi:hypothetical protein